MRLLTLLLLQLNKQIHALSYYYYYCYHHYWHSIYATNGTCRVWITFYAVGEARRSTHFSYWCVCECALCTFVLTPLTFTKAIRYFLLFTQCHLSIGEFLSPSFVNSNKNRKKVQWQEIICNIVFTNYATMNISMSTASQIVIADWCERAPIKNKMNK